MLVVSEDTLRIYISLPVRYRHFAHQQAPSKSETSLRSYQSSGPSPPASAPPASSSASVGPSRLVRPDS